EGRNGQQAQQAAQDHDGCSGANPIPEAARRTGPRTVPLTPPGPSVSLPAMSDQPKLPKPDLKPLIARVAAGERLGVEEARLAFDIMMSGEATPSQMGGFLMALRVRGETVEEITGGAMTMRAKALTVEAPAGAIDTCGTGGDASGTLNVSTAAALV